MHLRKFLMAKMHFLNLKWGKFDKKYVNLRAIIIVSRFLLSYS